MSNNSFPALVNLTIEDTPVYEVDFSSMVNLVNLYTKDTYIVNLSKTVLPTVTSLTLLNTHYLETFDSYYFPNITTLDINA